MANKLRAIITRVNDFDVMMKVKDGKVCMAVDGAEIPILDTSKEEWVHVAAHNDKGATVVFVDGMTVAMTERIK